MQSNEGAFYPNAIDWDQIAEIEKEMESHWFVDAEANAIDNLEMIEHFLMMSESPWRWKWVVIAAHQTLYSFLILALAGTAPSLHVTEPEMAGMVHYLSHRGLTAREIAQKLGLSDKPVSKSQVEKLLKSELKLISIWKAIERMSATTPNTGEPHNPERNDYLPWSHSRRLTLTDEQDSAIKTLINEFRNGFEHFQPKYWYIVPELFPPLLSHILCVIRFVALESNCILDFGSDQEKRVKSAIERIQMHLNLLNQTSLQSP